MRQGKFCMACYMALAIACMGAPNQANAESSLLNRKEPNSVELIETDTMPAGELIRLKRYLRDNGISLSLNEAIIRGIQRNPELEETFNTIQQFEWQLIAARRRWYPNIRLSNGTPFTGYRWGTFVENQYGLRGRGQRMERAAEDLFTSDRSESYVLQPGATVNWNFIEPTRSPNINAASEALEQQKFLFAVSARNLILQIQSSYFRAQRSMQLINYFEDILKINESELRAAKARLVISQATILDVAQKHAQLHSQFDQLVNFINDYISDTAELAALTAAKPGQLIVPSQPAMMQGEWDIPLDKTLSLAISQREEIKASMAAAQAASWRGVEAINSYLPVIGLTGNGNLNYNNGYANVLNGNDPGDAYRWQRNWNANAGIGFKWSIFDGGIRLADSQAFQEQSDSLEAQAANEELEAIRQVESSYSLLETSKIALTSAKEAYKYAYLAQEAARARYDAGVGDMTTVVQTMNQLARASAQVANAIFDHNNSVAQLYRYSATWPEETESEVDERTQNIRNGSNTTAEEE